MVKFHFYPEDVVKVRLPVYNNYAEHFQMSYDEGAFSYTLLGQKNMINLAVFKSFFDFRHDLIYLAMRTNQPQPMKYYRDKYLSEIFGIASNLRPDFVVTQRDRAIFYEFKMYEDIDRAVASATAQERQRQAVMADHGEYTVWQKRILVDMVNLEVTGPDSMLSKEMFEVCTFAYYATKFLREHDVMLSRDMTTKEGVELGKEIVSLLDKIKFKENIEEGDWIAMSEELLKHWDELPTLDPEMKKLLCIEELDKGAKVAKENRADEFSEQNFADHFKSKGEKTYREDKITPFPIFLNVAFNGEQGTNNKVSDSVLDLKHPLSNMFKQVDTEPVRIEVLRERYDVKKIVKSTVIEDPDNPDVFTRNKLTYIGLRTAFKENIKFEATSDKLARNMYAKFNFLGPKIRLSAEEADAVAKKIGDRGMGNKDYVKHKKQKAPFSLRSKTHNIQAFVETKKFFEESPFRPPKNVAMSHALVKKAVLMTNESISDKFGVNEFIDTYLKSKCYNTLSWLSSVMSVVANYARSKTSGNDYRLYRIPYTNDHVAMISRGIGKNIFMCILKEKNKFNGEKTQHVPGFGRIVEETDDWYLTDGFTLSPRHIGDLINVENKAGSIIASMADNFTIPVPTLTSYIFKGREETDLTHLNVQEHAMFFIMMSIHAKKSTNVLCMTIRYMMNQFAKVYDANPWIATVKFNGVLRCSVQVWIVKRLKTACNYMMRKGVYPVKTDEEDTSDTRFANLISFVNQRTIVDFKVFLQLMYCGTLQSKDAGDRFMSVFAVLLKVAKYEYKFQDLKKSYMASGKRSLKADGVFLGYHSNPLKPKELHEFDIGITKSAVLHWIDKKGNGDPYFQKKLFESIFMEMAKMNVGKFLTLSSTAGVPDKMACKTSDKKDSILRTRDKLIVNYFTKFIPKYGKGHPMKKLKEISISLDQRGYIICEITNKEQFGGDREIHILAIDDRVEIAGCEAIFRGAAQHAENEFLTKSDMIVAGIRANTAQIAAIGKAHMRNADNPEKDSMFKSASDVGVMRFQTSGDMSKWSPLANMMENAAFFYFLIGHFDKVLARFIVKMFELHGKKRIVMPQFVAEVIDNSKKFVVHGEENERFVNDYKNTTGIFVENGMIQTESGFWQGIIHYGGSLRHAIYREFFNDIFTEYFAKYRNIDVFVKTTLNSDDFSSQFAIFYSISDMNEQSVKYGISMKSLVVSLCIQIAHALPGTCHNWSARVSWEKSTVCIMSRIIEIVSMWLTDVTVMIPNIKYIKNVHQISPKTTLINRNYESNSAIRRLGESGMSTAVCAIMEQLGGLSSYVPFGLHSNIAFMDFAESMMENPHPALGFSLMSPVALSGIVPLDFNMWLACKNDETGSFRRIDSVLERDKTPGLTETATIAVNFLSGNGFKTYLIRSKISRSLKSLVGMDLDQIRKTKYELYIRDPNPNSPNYDDELMMQKSLSLLNTINTSADFAGNLSAYTTAYVLHEPVCMIKDSSFSEDVTMEKTSLMNLIVKVAERAADVPEAEIEVSSHLKRYRNNLAFKIMSDILETSKFDNPRAVVGKLHKRAKTIGYPDLEMRKISLKQVLAYFWFGDQTILKRHSVKRLAQDFGRYKVIYKNLNDTLPETTKAMNFETDGECCRFFGTQFTSKKFLRFQGWGKMNSFGMALRSILRNNVQPGIVYLQEAKVEKTISTSIIKRFKNSIFSIGKLWVTAESKAQLTDHCIKNAWRQLSDEELAGEEFMNEFFDIKDPKYTSADKICLSIILLKKDLDLFYRLYGPASRLTMDFFELEGHHSFVDGKPTWTGKSVFRSRSSDADLTLIIDGSKLRHVIARKNQKFSRMVLKRIRVICDRNGFYWEPKEDPVLDNNPDLNKATYKGIKGIKLRDYRNAKGFALVYYTNKDRDISRNVKMSEISFSNVKNTVYIRTSTRKNQKLTTMFSVSFAKFEDVMVTEDMLSPLELGGDTRVTSFLRDKQLNAVDLLQDLHSFREGVHTDAGPERIMYMTLLSALVSNMIVSKVEDWGAVTNKTKTQLIRALARGTTPDIQLALEKHVNVPDVELPPAKPEMLGDAPESRPLSEIMFDMESIFQQVEEEHAAMDYNLDDIEEDTFINAMVSLKRVQYSGNYLNLLKNRVERGMNDLQEAIEFEEKKISNPLSALIPQDELALDDYLDSGQKELKGMAAIILNIINGSWEKFNRRMIESQWFLDNEPDLLSENIIRQYVHRKMNEESVSAEVDLASILKMIGNM